MFRGEIGPCFPGRSWWFGCCGGVASSWTPRRMANGGASSARTRRLRSDKRAKTRFNNSRRACPSPASNAFSACAAKETSANVSPLALAARASVRSPCEEVLFPLQLGPSQTASTHLMCGTPLQPRVWPTKNHPRPIGLGRGEMTTPATAPSRDAEFAERARARSNRIVASPEDLWPERSPSAREHREEVGSELWEREGNRAGNDSGLERTPRRRVRRLPHLLPQMLHCSKTSSHRYKRHD